MQVPLVLSIGMKQVSSTQVLLIKCTSLLDHQQVWAPLLKHKIWQFAGVVHSETCATHVPANSTQSIFNFASRCF